MLKFSAISLSHHALRVRAIELVLLAAPLVGAYYYGHKNESPPLFCPFRALTGIPCPSCGMSRSFMAIATGQFEQALDYHFFGIFLFIGFAIAVIHLSLEILSQRKITAFYHQLIFNKKNQFLLIIMFLAYYFIRLYVLLETGESIKIFSLYY